MACILGMRSFALIWMISAFLLNYMQSFENAWGSSAQWQHLTSVLVHLSLLCLWKLHLEHVFIVS